VIVIWLRKLITSVPQEQQRVAVGPGNAHFISISQVSSDAVTLRRSTFGQFCMARRCCCSSAAAADTALGNMLLIN